MTTITFPVADEFEALGDYRQLRIVSTPTHCTFDMNARYSGAFYNVCANIDEATARQVIEALQAAFPEPAPAPYVEPVPDITVPEGNFDDPSAVRVDLDGKALMLVNWLDFKGWEVRRKAKWSDESGLLLGWVRNCNSADVPVVATSARVVSDPSPAGEFDRVDEALRWLLKVANA